ncbi:hypothetical protein [Algoriphagus limi]|uniref:Tetratricopeptide repeat-containing protein n=1 Tax=Algoriphagus limi TaxID=2975273 RepID=A0ABT2G1V1_9BACT|nr:hypothetical protein [Algoriphagus limi]MCS5489240.1 hypothetical protein [Algoriphagus limi]
MKTNIDLNVLEDYLDKKLTPEKQLEVENALAKDGDLNLELKTLEKSRNAIQLAEWKKVIASSQSDFLEYRKTHSLNTDGNKSSIGTWFLRIAASFIVVLVGLGSFLVLSTTPENLEKNFLSYQVPVMRGEGESTLSQLKEAYSKNDFQLVIELGSNQQNLDKEGLFLVAMSNLELGNGMEAASELLELQNKNQQDEVSFLDDEIDYYLVKAYILQGDYSKAKNQVDKIRSTPNHKYRRNVDRWDAFKIQILDWKN